VCITGQWHLSRGGLGSICAYGFTSGTTVVVWLPIGDRRRSLHGHACNSVLRHCFSAGCR